MHCLGCGHCCSSFAPCGINPCPALVEVRPSVFRCSAYENRPKQCKDHDYPGRFCPIGVDVLGFTEADQVARRLDLLWDLTQNPPDDSAG